MIITRREQLIEGLRGQAVQVPDLRPIFSGWPGAYGGNISPHWKELVSVVNEKLRRCVEGGANWYTSIDYEVDAACSQMRPNLQGSKLQILLSLRLHGGLRLAWRSYVSLPF